jgi:mRNA interferase MazF
VNLFTGDVVWAQLGPSRGRKQTGRRPLVVVASNDYLETIDTLVIAIPVTSTDRGWPNHVRLQGQTGLAKPSFGMTEQVTTISRERISAVSGHVDDETLTTIAMYLRDFLR